MSYSEPIAIAFSKKKLIKLCVLCAVFIMLGIWHLIPNASFESRYLADSTVREAIGFSLLLVFGLFIIYPVYKLFDKTPGLILNEAGIADNSSAIAIGMIIWADIDAFITTKQSNAKFVTILLNDPQKFIDREANSMRRQMMLANYKRTGSPINISTNILAISHEKLMELLEDKLLASRVDGIGKQSEL